MLDEHNYDHLLEKEALVLRAKQQKMRDKESLTEAEVKHHRLNALLLVAVQDKKLLGSQIRGATIQGEKAEERIEALDDSMESVKVALEAKGGELESSDANLKEAKKELRRVHREAEKELSRLRSEVKVKCEQLQVRNSEMQTCKDLHTQHTKRAKTTLDELIKERDNLLQVRTLPLSFS
jgi:hypothetical protein